MKSSWLLLRGRLQGDIRRRDQRDHIFRHIGRNLGVCLQFARGAGAGNVAALFLDILELEGDGFRRIRQRLVQRVAG